MNLDVANIPVSTWHQGLLRLTAFVAAFSGLALALNVVV